MADVQAYSITGLRQDATNAQVINGVFNIPVDGYLIILKQQGASPTITVDGVSMAQIGWLGNTARSYLFGLKVTAGNKTIVGAPNTYSIHAAVFSLCKGFLQIATGLTKSLSTFTPQKGHCVAQFLYASRTPDATWGTHYTPPTGFTELSDSGALGSGGDWWHGGASSYRINTGVAAISRSFGDSAPDTNGTFESYTVELEKVQAGGSQVIWWN